MKTTRRNQATHSAAVVSATVLCMVVWLSLRWMQKEAVTIPQSGANNNGVFDPQWQQPCNNDTKDALENDASLKPSLFDGRETRQGVAVITCLMPTYNRHYFLARQIRQVARQRLPPKYQLQLVIVDDSPVMAPSALFAGKPWIKYVFVNERSSVGGKRNIGIDAADGDFIFHVDDDDLMSATRVTAQLLAFDSPEGPRDMVIPRVAWALDINEPSYLFPSSITAAHGLMAYRKTVFSKCRFQDTSIGEDDLFIQCVYYNGIRIASVEETAVTIVVLVHGNNVWNAWKAADEELPGAPRPPRHLWEQCKEEDFGDPKWHVPHPDKRPINQGVVWKYDDVARPWFWLLFGGMPSQGLWPRMTNSAGCPLAHVNRMLNPQSGTTLLTGPRNQQECEAALGGETGGWRPWRGSACPLKCGTCAAGSTDGGTALFKGRCSEFCSRDNYCGRTKGYKNGGTDCTECKPASCLRCSSACHFFDGRECRVCTRCSSKGGDGVSLHIRNCTATTDTVCSPQPSWFHLGEFIYKRKDITQRCGHNFAAPDGLSGVCSKVFDGSNCCVQESGLCKSYAETDQCRCPTCQDFKRVPWRLDGQCGQGLICDPYGTTPCCDFETKTCVESEGFTPKLDEDDLGEEPLSEYQCFTPESYLKRTRRLFGPIWESPPSETEARESQALGR